MRDNEINELISEALRDAPKAPNELRHNVMATIAELEASPKRRKLSIFKAATAVAGVAVFAVVVIVGSSMKKDNNGIVQFSYSPASGGAAPSMMDIQAKNDSGNADEFAVSEDDAQDMGTEAADTEPMLADSAKSSAQQLVFGGELPSELKTLSYIELSDGSRLYEDVASEIAWQIIYKQDDEWSGGIEIYIPGDTIDIVWNPEQNELDK